MELKRVLKELLRQRNITVQDLAEATQIAPSSIRTWISGASPRNLDDLRAVSKYFGVSVDYLLWDDGPVTIPNFEEHQLDTAFKGWIYVDLKRPGAILCDGKTSNVNRKKRESKA